MFVRIEPVTAGFTAAEADAVLRGRGLQPAPANQQPELSWIVDLDRDFKDVLADMKPANRNLYRNIHKKGVTFRSSQDPAEIAVLLEFLHMTAARNGFKPQSDEYLSQVARSLMPAGAATLFIAELEGRPSPRPWRTTRPTPGPTPTPPWTTPTASSARAFPCWSP